MSDTFETHRARMEEFQRKLQYPGGAVGAAVAVAGKIVAIDLFDKPATCQRVWSRLLSGTVLDALEIRQVDRQTEVADVRLAVAGLHDLSWEPAESAGEGDEYRAESSTGDHASALGFHGTLVHGSPSSRTPQMTTSNDCSERTS